MKRLHEQYHDCEPGEGGTWYMFAVRTSWGMTPLKAGPRASYRPDYGCSGGRLGTRARLRVTVMVGLAIGVRPLGAVLKVRREGQEEEIHCA